MCYSASPWEHKKQLHKMKMQTACLTQDWPLKRNTFCGLKTWFPNTGSPRANWRGLSNDTFGSVAFREWGLFVYLFFFRRTLQTVSCCNLGKHLLAAGVCGISCSDGEVPVSPPSAGSPGAIPLLCSSCLDVLCLLRLWWLSSGRHDSSVSDVSVLSTC